MAVNETLVNLFFANMMALVLFGVVIMASVAFGLVFKAEGYNLTHETTVSDNPAIGIRYALFLTAVVYSFSSVVHPSGISFTEDLNLVAKYSVMIIAMLLVSRYINDWLILSGFDNNKEVVGEKNVAVAIVEGATYLATAFIISGALAGFEGGLITSLVWFAIGQIFFVALALIYRLFVLDTFDALDDHNTSCALSLGGLLLSGGIALGKAVNGQFHGWTEDLQNVGFYVLGWAIFMFIAALIADKVLLPSARLREEVMYQRNVAAGAVESVMFVSATLIYNIVI